MKPWWDNPEYHSATADNKIAAWAEHCKALRKALDEAECELRQSEQREGDITTANAPAKPPVGDPLTRLVELVREVMFWHRDKKSSDYNECDTAPCHWCEQAQKAIDDLPNQVLDFQTAPYKTLCGCVSVMIPPGTNHLWKDDQPNHEATAHLIRNAVGNRVVLSDCPKCGGTGIAPNRD